MHAPDMGRRLDAAWKKGFARHKRLLAEAYKSKLSALDSSDRSIPLHVYKLSLQQCASRHVEAVQMLNLFTDIQLYELPRTLR